MTKHITLFDTTTEYNNADLDLPNVSYTLDDLKVHYNPYKIKLVCKYNVTSTSSTTKLLDSNSNISAIEIDGIALDSVITDYTFTTTGEHIVKYTLIDNSSIGSSMFEECSSLTNITIPNSVISIGQCAFLNCSGLTSMTISNSLISISNLVFSGCSGLTDVIIPDSVTSIGSYAFERCSSLTSVVIPDSVTSIGSEAFADCSGLISMIIGDFVISIGNAAFWGCSNLESINIPNSVTSIGSQVFYNCSGLTTLIVQATTPPSLGSDALSDTNTNLIIKVPSASVNTYKLASGWSAYANKIQSI